MTSRYSREELKEIKSLLAQGLSSREIGSRLDRSEAGIKNVLYRFGLRRQLVDSIRLLCQKKEGLESKINELTQRKAILSSEWAGLEDKKERLESVLREKSESLKRKIEWKLLGLKIEKPELFYLSSQEQSAILVGYIFRWLFS